MPLRMNMQSGRKHKSKLDVWENQWSGSLVAPLIFCPPPLAVSEDDTIYLGTVLKFV